MSAWFETSAKGYEIIKRFEGCKLTAYKKGADPWTVGWGITGHMPDGRPVVEGLTITQREADEALEWFVHNISDPLTRKHYNARTQDEFDALSSWVYNLNHGRLERGEYSLPRLVNMWNRDENAVIRKWVEYVNPRTIFEQGLYRRRLAEVCVFLGLPWHFALSASLKRSGGVVTDRTDPFHIIGLAEAAAAAARPIATEPDPPKAPVATVPIEAAPLPDIAPNVDPVAPPKPMETSKTHKGLSKKESGQETTIIGGTLAGMAIFLPYIDALTSFLTRYPATVIFSALGVVGLLVAGVGLWRWWVGKMMAWEGRQEAVQGKI